MAGNHNVQSVIPHPEGNFPTSNRASIQYECIPYHVPERYSQGKIPIAFYADQNNHSYQNSMHSIAPLRKCSVRRRLRRTLFHQHPFTDNADEASQRLHTTRYIPLRSR